MAETSCSISEGGSAADEFYFQWHITERCNKHCRHCYQDGTHSDELPLEQLGRILDLMSEAVTKWGRQGTLSFTGGEPFLRREVLFDLMRRVDSNEAFAYYDILTNGSLVDDGTAAKLTAFGKLRRVQVSLEGSTPQVNDGIRGDGSFDETLKAIRTMKRHGLTVSVMTTVSRWNAHDVLHIVDLLESEGVDAMSIERLVPEGHGADMRTQMLSPEELRDLYERLYARALETARPRLLLYRPLFALVAPDDPTVGALCSVGNNALTVMPDGTVYPCRRLPISIGNILEDGLFRIWYDSRLLWRIRDPHNLKGKCNDCPILTSCRGCRAMAYFASGDYLAEDPQCWR